MRLSTLLYAVLVTLVLAAVVHLATVLAVPHVAPRDAWTRIDALAVEDGMTLLPPAAPGESPLPFLDPSVVYGVCRYDVSEGPYAISAEMPPAFWTVSLHTSNGVVFYAVDDEGAVEGVLDIELRGPDAMRRYQLARTSEADTVLAVGAETPTGYALFRALVARGAQRGAVERALTGTFCGEIEETVVPDIPPPPEEEEPEFPFPRPRPQS